MTWKPSYATVEQMHDWLRLRGAEDVDDDDLLTLKLSAASRAVDKACGPTRQFGNIAAPVVRTYPARWSRTLGGHVADIDDLMDLTGLTVTIEHHNDADDVTIDSDHYKLRPRNAAADGMPYTYIVIHDHRGLFGCGCGFGFLGFGEFAHREHREVEISALWGWTEIPDPIVEATLLQTSRLNIRRDSPYGIAGGSDSGTELRLLERLDPDIAPIVAGYVRTGWTAR